MSTNSFREKDRRQRIRQMYKELMLRPQRSDETELILTDILKYPSIQDAQFHWRCNHLGDLDLAEEEQESHDPMVRTDSFYNHHRMHGKHSTQRYANQKLPEACECCRKRLQKQSVGLFEPLGKIKNMGMPTYLYFYTLISLVGMLLILSVVYSIFGAITNLQQSHSEQYLQVEIAKSFSLYMSLASKLFVPNEESCLLYNLQVGAAILTVIIWAVALGGAKRWQILKERQEIIQSYSAADFSLHMENIPTSCNTKTIIESFKRYAERVQPKNNQRHLLKQMNIVSINVILRHYLKEEEFVRDKILQALSNQIVKSRKKIVRMIRNHQGRNDFNIPEHERHEIIQRYAEALKLKDERIKEISQEWAKNPEEYQGSTYSAYITFETNVDRDLIINLNRVELSARLRDFFFCRNRDRFELLDADGNTINPIIDYSPEPEEIIWINQGRPYKQKVQRKILAFILIIVLCGLGLFAVYAVSMVNNMYKQNFIYSMITSLTITGLNVVIPVIVTMITDHYEREPSQTSYQSSLGLNLVVPQLINSILTPIAVHLWIEGNFVHTGGLIDDVLGISLTGLAVTPLVTFLNPGFIIHWLKIRLFKHNPDNNINQDQESFNKEYQKPPFEVGSAYTTPIFIWLYTCFFVTLQPLIAIISALTMTLYYFAKKHNVLHHCKRPYPGTPKIHNRMYDLILLGPLFFSCGNMFSAVSFAKESGQMAGLVPSIILIVLSLIFFILPFEEMFIYGRKMATYAAEEVLSFEKRRFHMQTDYARLNPNNAVYENLKFMEDKISYINRLPPDERDQFQQAEEISKARSMSIVTQAVKKNWLTESAANMQIYSSLQAQATKDVTAYQQQYDQSPQQYQRRVTTLGNQENATKMTAGISRREISAFEYNRYHLETIDQYRQIQKDVLLDYMSERGNRNSVDYQYSDRGGDPVPSGYIPQGFSSMKKRAQSGRGEDYYSKPNDGEGRGYDY